MSQANPHSITRGCLRLVTVDGEQVAPSPRRPRRDPKKELLKIHVTMIENHLVTMERALLLAASSLESARARAAELRTTEGLHRMPWEGLHREPWPYEAAFGDTRLFDEYELHILPKLEKPER